MIAVAVVGASATLTLTGCLGGNDKDPAGEGPTTQVSAGVSGTDSPAAGSTATGRPTSAASTPPGWKTIGGPDNGLSFAVPEGWTEIHLTQGNLEEGLDKLGLKGPSAATMRQSLQQLQQQKAVFAIETESAAKGYATSVNGLCSPSATGSLDQLKASVRLGLTKIGARNVQVTDTLVAGVPGVKTSYELNSQLGVLTGRQYMVNSGGRSCTVTVTAKQGDMPADTDRIADTTRML
ncbi:hypothetical protein [Actinomadura macrotermitis]|nr:hypothetical protein [Actinomadura macrotermitis]